MHQYERPHVPLYARPRSALHACSQSRTFVVPAVVQTVSEPSPLQVASVPEHGGKHVSSTRDVEDSSSAQLALESASAQVPVTRIAVNWLLQSSIVTACPHSVMRRLQSFSALIGRRLLVPPPDDDVAPELELLEDDDDDDDVLVSVPGYGSHPTTAIAKRPSQAHATHRRPAKSPPVRFTFIVTALLGLTATP